MGSLLDFAKLQEESTESVKKQPAITPLKKGSLLAFSQQEIKPEGKGIIDSLLNKIGFDKTPVNASGTATDEPTSYLSKQQIEAKAAPFEDLAIEQKDKRTPADVLKQLNLNLQDPGFSKPDVDPSKQPELVASKKTPLLRQQSIAAQQETIEPERIKIKEMEGRLNQDAIGIKDKINNFKELKKSIEESSNGIRTKEGLDSYNEKVKEYRAKVEEYKGNVAEYNKKAQILQKSLPDYNSEAEALQQDIKELNSIKTQLPERIGKGFAKGITGMPKGISGVVSALGFKKTGKDLNKAVEKFEENYLHVHDPNFIDKLSAGFGSGATFLIPGLGVIKGAGALGASTKLAAMLGTTFSAVLESMIEGGSTYNEAISKGKSHEEARKSGAITFGVNLPLNYVLDNWIFKSMPEGKRLSASFKGATSEASQEAVQNIISSFAQGEMPDLKETLESAAIGGITGGAMAGAKAVVEDTAPIVSVPTEAGVAPIVPEVTPEVTPEITTIQPEIPVTLPTI